MGKPLVSIIMNCYNGEEFLRQAVESVISQTYSNWEIIFWDNCSIDKSEKIIKSYIDIRIKYFHGDKNVPLGKARNLAIEKANGVYIAFLDTDDIWNLNKLQIQLNKFEEDEEISLVHSNYIQFWSSGKELAHSKDNTSTQDFKSLLTNYNIGMSSAIVKRSILDKYYIYFDDSFSLIEDYYYFLLVSYYGKVGYCKETLMNYRMHQNSLTALSIRNWSSEFEELIKRLKKLINKDDLPDYKQEIKWIQTRSKNSLILELIHNGNKKKAIMEILSSLNLSYKLVFLLFGVFFGYNSYMKLRNKLNHKVYRI